MVCLDTNTRWNRLSAMLGIFSEIKSTISKALIDVKEQQIFLMLNLKLTTNVTGLKPLKIGLEKLCSRIATFLTAEEVFAFIIGQLNQENSEFAKNMKCSLAKELVRDAMLVYLY
ncbi:hypothetical protein AVEN_203158-1 [Araneus ventricosus]|uniref:DUF4371 domain-containing protein n=1 Tax=Araneus ventricosus TaxID=182803 RepID=A0A4Y2CGY2_ARAVE|nr:hypothetical protein AVEN_203158-1 [Araneus ventricosus]